MTKYELDIANRLLPRPCPLCKAEYGSNTMLHIFDQRLENGDLNYVIVECLKCGFIHQNPAWNQEFYNNLYSFFFYDLTGRNFHPEYVKQYKVVSSLLCNLPSVCAGARILDFGCNDGSFIQWVKDNTDWARDIELIGYDICLRGVRDGMGFFSSMSKLLLTKKKFDVIVMNFVLEHVLNPVDILVFISDSLLKDSGYIVIEVPDMSFINDFDFSPFHIQHTNYFTPTTMSMLLKSAGLATYAIETLNNFDIGRNPNSPSLQTIGQKHQNYLKNGKALHDHVALHRKQFQDRIKGLFKSSSLGIVGCGDALRSIIGLLSDVRITALFDNNENLWGVEMYGNKVQPVEKIKHCNCDIILVCTLYVHSVKQIKKQLSKYISLDKVITIFDDIVKTEF